MQTVRLPRSLCDEKDRMSRQFLWGGTTQTRCVHNVSWGQLTKPKQAEGLGFKTMRETNAAFLIKLDWKLMVEKHKLWSQVLRAKHCNSRCDIDMFQPKADASNTWRGILKNVDFLIQGLRTDIGNGKRTLLWPHIWADSKPLCQHTLNDIPPHIQDNYLRNYGMPKLFGNGVCS